MSLETDMVFIITATCSSIVVTHHYSSLLKVLSFGSYCSSINDF